MSTRPTSAADADPDTLAIIDHLMTGKPLDPAVASRVRADAERATQELRRTVGTLTIAVDLIREIRDEE
jgi:hypothetical protein